VSAAGQVRSLRGVDPAGLPTLGGYAGTGLAFAFAALLEELAERIAERLAEKLEERRWATHQEACELFSVQEAAEVLRCKPQRVYDLRSAGRLPRTMEGGRAVVRRTDLERLVAEE
jgi:excisionase family DNA binding protein